MFFPGVRQYIKKKHFLFCSKENITTLLNRPTEWYESFRGIIPGPDCFEKSVNGGIQKIIKQDI